MSFISFPSIWERSKPAQSSKSAVLTSNSEVFSLASSYYSGPQKIIYFGVHMGSLWGPRVRFGTAKVVILCDTSIKNWFWEGLRFRASISYEVRSLFSFLIDVSSEMLTFDPAMDPQSDLKKALKLLKIGVEKRYSVLIPKWTVLGVHFGSKKGPKKVGPR